MTRTQQEARTPRSAAQKWIRDPGNLDTYIKLVQANDTAVDTISEIDLNPDVFTEYEVETYALRRYPSTKINRTGESKIGQASMDPGGEDHTW